MERQESIQKFVQRAESIGIHLSDLQIQQFLDYYNLLVEKNKVMNLTAITDFDEVIEKHFLDSLLPAKIYDFTQKKRVMDLGTGAGFPGIPLKIVFPQLEIVLADSLNKRVKFLDEVIEKLNLNQETNDKNQNFGRIETVHGRAENLGRMPEYREQFDVCVSRAVASLPVLAEYCLPFVKPGGYFIAYKSEQIEDELQKARHAIKILNGKVKSCEKVELPGSDMVRSFVVIEKVGEIGKRYPRKAGTPSKNPLN